VTIPSDRVGELIGALVSATPVPSERLEATDVVDRVREMVARRALLVSELERLGFDDAAARKVWRSELDSIRERDRRWSGLLAQARHTLAGRIAAVRSARRR
jgi:hypothetical protein